MPDHLTTNQIHQISEELNGTAMDVRTVLEMMGLDPDDEEEVLDRIDVEECQGCGWWHEACELTPDPDEPAFACEEEATGFCDDCRAERWGMAYDD